MCNDPHCKSDPRVSQGKDTGYSSLAKSELHIDHAFRILKTKLKAVKAYWSFSVEEIWHLVMFKVSNHIVTI